MINACNLTKKFVDKTAVENMSCTIEKGSIFGIVGCNGAGKSTFMRLLAGIYKPDAGEITYDGQPVYDNAAVKKRLVFIPDDMYLPAQSTMNHMADMYCASYDRFNRGRFNLISSDLKLDRNKTIGTYSKGMKRQVAMALALSCMADYVLFDETFDGLDPVIRRYFKDIIYMDSAERGVTAIITSHSLRELEDTCDHLAMLHDGGLAFSCEVDDIKTDLFKIQLAFRESCSDLSFEDMDVLHCTLCGSVVSLIVRGDKAEVRQKMQEREPVLLEVMPLSIEEIFIYEMQERGYGIGNLPVKEGRDEKEIV